MGCPGFEGTFEARPDCFGHRRGAAERDLAGALSSGGGSEKSFQIDTPWSTFTRGLHHPETSQCGANAVKNRHLRRPSLFQRAKKVARLRCVTFFGKPARLAAYYTRFERESFEILGHRSRPWGKGFHALSSRASAAHRAIRKIGD